LWRTVTIGPHVEILHAGVSKASCAGAAARTLDPAIHRAMLSLGIAGALPDTAGKFPLPVRGCVVATKCVFADEGLVTQDGYTDLTAMGFPMDPECGNAFPTDPGLRAAFLGNADAAGV